MLIEINEIFEEQLELFFDVSKSKMMFPTYLSAGDCVSNGVGIGGHIPDISILWSDFVIGLTESRDKCRPIIELPFLNIFMVFIFLSE